MSRILNLLKAPVLDFWNGLSRCLDHGYKGLLLALLGLGLGWWMYVPVHEFLHVAGCVVTGGEVRELRLDTIYGGRLFAQVFDFVKVGSAYAGQLTDFDREPDLRYLSTVQMPFLLTIFPAVWLFQKCGRVGHPLGFGFLLPVALAPFVSITGDAYETGSILVTQLPPWSSPEMRELLRGDDLVLCARRVSQAAFSPWGGWALSSLIGIVWAFAVYGLGALVSRQLTSP